MQKQGNKTIEKEEGTSRKRSDCMYSTMCHFRLSPSKTLRRAKEQVDKESVQEGLDLLVAIRVGRNLPYSVEIS